jgi:predicted RecA/RadA family phage recombinase
MGLTGRAHNPTGLIAHEVPASGSLLGSGSIVSVQQTTVNTGTPGDPSHECVFTVEVALDGASRYTATCRQSVRAMALVPLMLPGATVAVRVDPADRSRIALSLGEPLVAPVAAMTAGP